MGTGARLSGSWGFRRVSLRTWWCSAQMEDLYPKTAGTKSLARAPTPSTTGSSPQPVATTKTKTTKPLSKETNSQFPRITNSFRLSRPQDQEVLQPLRCRSRVLCRKLNSATLALFKEEKKHLKFSLQT